MKVRTFLLFFCLLTLALSDEFTQQSLGIVTAKRIQVSIGSSFQLKCVGQIGKVNYEVIGLPLGAQLKGDHILIEDYAEAGDYVVVIRVQDEEKRKSEKIATLSIKSSSSGSASSASQPILETPEDYSKQKISELIQSYSTITTVERTKYEKNTYPEISFPTGYDSSTINLTPTKIKTIQAQTSSKNRNIITSDDVALRTASQRHQNSVKAITNLLTIIDQARANRNYAQTKLEVYVKAYNDALEEQRKSQDAIIAAETRRSQIFSAIEGAEGKIISLKRQIEGIQDTRANLKAIKKEILEKIQGQEKIKAQLLSELEKINSRLAILIKELAAKKQKCEIIKSQINSTEDELNKAKQNLANFIERRKAAEDDVEKKSIIVEDFRKKLADAEKNLAEAEIKLAEIISQEKKLPVIIAGIERKLNKLLEKYRQCKQGLANLQSLINQLQTDDLMNQIEQVEGSIIENRKKVMGIDQELSKTLQPLENLKVQLENAEKDLAYLKTQIAISEESLRQAYIKGNDANTHVAHSKQNLDAINQRYQEEERIISEATLNLERARAEEALARLALEEIIAHYSDALPFAIVPNGNGQTEPGTPYGNNPSGSPLGPIKTNGNGAPGSFVIEDFTHYLSQAFGQGVHPAFAGSVTRLFPFNFRSTVEGNKVQNDYGNLRDGENNCGGYGPVRVTNGRVIQVGENSFKVQIESGQIYNIVIESCTGLNANVSNYEMRIGDEAILKAIQRSPQKMIATQVTCLKNSY